MKSILVKVVLLMFSQSTFAQLSPVLHDADGLAIGNIIGFGATYQNEYANVISLQGFRAKMGYLTPSVPIPEGYDLPGYSAREYFESSECTGDPVMVPSAVMSNNVSLKDDFSDANLFLSIWNLSIAGVDKFQSGDMFEFNGDSYYIPLDAEMTSFESKSMRFLDSCFAIERCSYNSWLNYGFLLTFDGDAEVCPNIPDHSNNQPRFVVTGFPFSAVKPNDPSVTGFQSIKYRPPYRIRYVDINKVFTNGFEVRTE